MQPTHLTAQMVCARYAISRSTLYALVRRNDLPAPERLGGRVARWSVAALDAADERRAQAVA